MNLHRYFLLATVLVTVAVPRNGNAQDSKPALAKLAPGQSIVDEALQALGSSSVNSIEISGRGSDYLFGQSYDGSLAWPRFGVPRFKLSIDYPSASIRDERTRVQAQNPPLGGGNQPINEQRQLWLASGKYAWNEGGGNGRSNPAGAERDQRSAVEGRQTQILLTPHGFLKAALAANSSIQAKTYGTAKKTLVSFETPFHRRIQGTINEQKLLDHIETWIDSPVLGDTLLEAEFTDYRDFDGLKFPSHIVQREGGYPVLNITVTAVKANVAAALEVPSNIRDAKPAAEKAEPEKLAKGIWRINAGGYQPPKSFAIEFKDYIAVIEAPDSEARSLAVIETVKHIIPNKPIRYIVNTHTHFDHSGGLRTYAAEGATILTHPANIAYYQQEWANPRTIHPDALAKSGKTSVFEGVVGSRTLSDGTQRLVIYHYAGNMHNPGMLMIYLPNEKILIEADSFNPQNNPEDSPTAIPNLVQFYGAVQQLGLDVDQIVPIHGRSTTMAEAKKDIEAYQPGQLWPQ